MIIKMVRIILLTLPISILMQGCEGTYSGFVKPDKPECSDGGTYVNVHYGDSLLKVKPIANVHRGGAFEFRLKPKTPKGKEKNYDNALVTIKGKAGTGGLDASWIEADNKGNPKKRTLVVCVPEGQDIGTYYYSIHVEDLGLLDPRADVQQ